MKPWQLGDGDNTVATEQLRMEFIFDSINRQLAAIGVTDQTTFDAFANYIGYSTGGTPSYQNMQVAWTPTNLKLGETLGYFMYAEDPTNLLPSNLVFDHATNLGGYDIEGSTTLQTASWPNLVSVDPNSVQNGYITIQGHSALTSLSFPLLQTCAGGFTIISNPLLTSIAAPVLSSVSSATFANNALTALSLTSLVSAPGGNFVGQGNAGLVSVSIPVFVPTNGKSVLFSGCALSQASVDHILARCVANAAYVSGTVDLSGGTSSPPSSIAPGSDYDILINRGVVVNVNP